MKRRRLQRQFMDVFKEDTELVGVTVEEGGNRDRWGQMIHHGDPLREQSRGREGRCKKTKGE